MEKFSLEAIARSRPKRAVAGLTMTGRVIAGWPSCALIGFMSC